MRRNKTIFLSVFVFLSILVSGCVENMDLFEIYNYEYTLDSVVQVIGDGEPYYIINYHNDTGEIRTFASNKYRTVLKIQYDKNLSNKFIHVYDDKHGTKGDNYILIINTTDIIKQKQIQQDNSGSDFAAGAITGHVVRGMMSDD